ncbi:NADAR family protein [Actinokineospora auranticolor]|uniref:Putative NAD-dependent protein-ADP-ribosyltransferase YbiA (DUF1768 family) n=1 Tax=Actinokineospora auranticolor TaxID=155976 RepID=A0A2S6GX24_9PSEU|nr:NADAR family protein [Actinokineospora auranticolor]PPK69736.1 putative NAD-dependent protein-ADP-ribosyltransferase YbiA (DUF1768 family) [Actinokineospora auranticolor]
MGTGQSTWRTVDGERIIGSSRPVFVRNHGEYHLDNLVVYADGMVDWGTLHTFDDFVAAVTSGWIATELPEGATASAYQLAGWEFANPRSRITAEGLIGEARDVIDRYNDRPDSAGRCVAALKVFRDHPTEENRAVLRAAFAAVPEHRRDFLLGDHDRKGWPLRVVAAGPGNHYVNRLGGAVLVTEEKHAEALDYLVQQGRAAQRYAEEEAARLHAEGEPASSPPEPDEPTVVISEPRPSDERPPNPGILVLRNEFPAPITVAGRTYPTVTHAYWALAVANERDQAAILRTEAAYDARLLAMRLERRADWPHLRTATMAYLLRLKSSAHPAFAQALAATGTARLVYPQELSDFWGVHGVGNRNRMGQLLELIRSESALSRAWIRL